MRWLLKGGRVVDPSQGIDEVLDVLVADGHVAALGKDLDEAGETVDCTGHVVAPGFIDLRADLGEPGREQAETIGSGTRAAAAGGFTAVCVWAGPEAVIDDAGWVSFVRERARREGVVRVYPLAAITKGGRGDELTEMGELKDAGAVALWDGPRAIARAGVLRRALEYARLWELPVVVHCEDADLAGPGVMHEGFHATVHGLPGVPAAAEEIVVARDLLLAELTGARLHIAHVSTAGSVALIRAAKARGVAVTTDVTPHHLVWTDADVEPDDAHWRLRPPLRTAADAAALIEGLRDGTIDCIATDHSPCTLEEKQVEFDRARPGIIGLETALPLLVTRVVAAGQLSLGEVIARLSHHPARALGLPGGTLAPGSPADLTVIDLNTERVYDPAQGWSRSRNTPLAGWRLQGWPVATMVGGRWVVREGRVMA
ncbi:MAG TPA: dihydroorotase [Limnochordales bacterium]|nr:dihydroorotase [Limnochordales bacterium]